MVDQKHFGRRSYRVIPKKLFSSPDDYDKSLNTYCRLHGYITEGPGENSSSARELRRFTEKMYQKVLGTKMAVRENTIGLDPDDTERIQVLWLEGFKDARVVTFCGMNYKAGTEPCDYTEKAKKFAKEFFLSDVWEYIPEDSIQL